MTRRKIQYWVIPPESDSEFVSSMEDILDTYALPYITPASKYFTLSCVPDFAFQKI